MNSHLPQEPLVRSEEPGDAGRIRRIYELAFGSPVEADLVDALRASDGVVLSLVSIIDEQIVGHVLITPVTVSTEHGEIPLLGLGPVAVAPASQGRGIGTHMIVSCLEQLRTGPHAGVVVVGEPEYYQRFGFLSASRWGLRWEIEVPDENFMVLELSPGRLAGVRGVVCYRPEFSRG